MPQANALSNYIFQTWHRLPNTIRPIFVCVCCSGGDVQTHAVECHCQNCPISKFLIRQPSPSRAMRRYLFYNNCLDHAE